MIKIRIKNADHEIDVRFPISENELYAKLAEIHAIEEKDAPQSAGRPPSLAVSRKGRAGSSGYLDAASRLLWASTNAL